jgi:hypothetical protein
LIAAVSTADSNRSIAGSSTSSGARSSSSLWATSVGRAAADPPIGANQPGLGGTRCADARPGPAARQHLAFDQQVFSFEAGARRQIGQLGDTQLHRGNLHQAKIVRVQRPFDYGEPSHQPVDIGFGPIRTAEKAFEIRLRTDNATPGTTLGAGCASRRHSNVALDRWRREKSWAVLYRRWALSRSDTADPIFVRKRLRAPYVLTCQ